VVKTYSLKRKTAGISDIHDLTAEAREKVVLSGIRNGQALFFVSGSTAGLTTVEFEPGLVADLKEFFERLIPRSGDYHHEQTWHDGNGFSHVRAAMLKPSLTVPVVNGQMTLGTWQQVVLVDFDNVPRSRDVILQIMGEP
jgi:secondary thiamine-phosphate synthase enzyme